MKQRIVPKGRHGANLKAESRYTRVFGHRLHWIEMGEGPVLVLLHGICDSHRTWGKAAPLLARTHRVLVLDLPGHGLSDRPNASYSLEWHARMVGTWLEQLGLDDVDLVGHSFGGGVAMWMTTTSHRARIRSLALVAAGGLGRDVTFALRLASLPLLFEHVGQLFMRVGTRLGMRAVGRGAYDDDEIRHLSTMNATPGSARAIARTLRGVVGWRGQLRHALDGACDIESMPPVALFWGESDPVLPIAQGVEAASRFGGVVMTRFGGCGHFPHLQHAEAFATALETFVARAPQSAVAA